MDNFYYWVSFSKVVPKGELGNLGAIIIRSHERLSEARLIDLCEDYGAPVEAPSIWASEIDEESALQYPIDTFMPNSELAGRDDVRNVRERVSVCPECAERHNLSANEDE